MNIIDIIKRIITSKNVIVDKVEYDEMVKIKNFNDSFLAEKLKINGVDMYSISGKGETIYNFARERLRRKSLKGYHDELIFRLIDFLKKSLHDKLYFSNFEINTQYGKTRPDLYVINNTITPEHYEPICYEIKYTHNDFLCDVRKGSKRASYSSISKKTYYVCPDGVISPDEIPKGFGLMYERESGVFDLIVEADNNDNWINKIDKYFINRLINHKNIDKKFYFIDKNHNEKSIVEKGDYFSCSLNKDLIRLDNIHINIMEGMSTTPITYSRLGLLDEQFGYVLDLIGLNFLTINKSEDNMFYPAQTYYKATESLVKFVSKNREIGACDFGYKFLSRYSKGKFTFENIHIKKISFDHVSMNIDNNCKNLLITGFKSISSLEELERYLEDSEYIEEQKKYCQKLAIFDRNKLIDVKKWKDKLQDIGVFTYYSHCEYDDKMSFPYVEKKRVKRRELKDVDISMLAALLKYEYENGITITLK